MRLKNFSIILTLLYLFNSCGSMNCILNMNNLQNKKVSTEALNSNNNNQQIIIVCTGDSFTEGMSMKGAGYAEYNKEPYPAQLYTMILDAGYKNVTVINQGQGGETVPTMLARTGGVDCFINSNIFFPSDSFRILINSSDDYKLEIPVKGNDNENYKIVFTDSKDVTNPILIDGCQYIMTIEHNVGWTKHYNYIQRIPPDNASKKIPVGATVITNSPKHPDVNIIYGGINGNNELNFEKWAYLMNACLETSKGRGLVIGSTHAIWNHWNDLPGVSFDEKYQSYIKKAQIIFGFRFLNLYDLFFCHGLDYCLEAGFFANKSQHELHEMQILMNNHIVPKEFSYDGNHQGDVHLNKAGYYVVAKLVFERLVKLDYLSRTK